MINLENIIEENRLDIDDLAGRIIVRWYEERASGSNSFELQSKDDKNCVEFQPMGLVIGKVSMLFDEETGSYNIDDAQKAVLDDRALQHELEHADVDDNNLNSDNEDSDR